MRPSRKWRRPIDVRHQCGLGGITDVVDRESAVAPRAVTAIAGGDHVMERDPAPLRHGRILTRRTIHPRQPPARHDFRLGWILHIDDAQDVIGKAVEMRRDICVASTRPPQAVDPEAGHLEECNLLHLCRAGNVVNAQARTKLLTVGDAVDERVLEIAAHVVVGLHRHDVGTIGEQQQVFGNL